MIAVDEGRGLPVLVTAADPSVGAPAALARWVAEHPERLAGWTDSVGAVLFRGFRVTTAHEFRRVADALLPDRRAYIGGDAPRHAVMDRIYDATGSPTWRDLGLHNELSYSGWWPASIIFCCTKPAAQGGQTTIADGRQVWSRLPEEIRRPFSTLGVTYHQHLRDAAVEGNGKSWQDTFHERCRERVEKYCRATGVRWHWTEVGLRTTKTNPGVLPGRSVDDPPHWFNQAADWHAESYSPDQRILVDGRYDIDSYFGAHAQYGDGSEIPLDVLDEVRTTCRSCEVPVDWESGDVLVVDNRLTMHGRRAYSGDRTVLIAMG